ncbi:hypothetical protein ScPMuIL_000848 [Solemya velum]
MEKLPACFPVCTLDKHSAEIAKKELNDDPQQRESAIQTFRDWIEQQKWLKCPTDDFYILGILRARKFSQLRARTLLENLWSVMTKKPEWYVGNDPEDPIQKKVLMDGSSFMLPNRDAKGRRILFFRASGIDTSAYTADELNKATIMLYDYLLMDEVTQVNGIIVVVDLADSSPKDITYLGFSGIKTQAESFQKSLPFRLKAIHVYRGGVLIDTVWPLIKPLWSEKLRNRMHNHGSSLDQLYEHIDMSLLPQEYLPDDSIHKSPITIQDCIDYTVQELSRNDFKDYCYKVHSGLYGIDWKLKDDNVLQESFRKLHTS